MGPTWRPSSVPKGKVCGSTWPSTHGAGRAAVPRPQRAGGATQCTRGRSGGPSRAGVLRRSGTRSGGPLGPTFLGPRVFGDQQKCSRHSLPLTGTSRLGRAMAPGGSFLSSVAASCRVIRVRGVRGAATMEWNRSALPCPEPLKRVAPGAPQERRSLPQCSSSPGLWKGCGSTSGLSVPRRAKRSSASAAGSLPRP